MYHRQSPYRPRSNGSGRLIAMFAGGAVAGVVAARCLSPWLGQAIGLARGAVGGDPFEALARDHRTVLQALDALAETPDDAVLRRTRMLLTIKHALTAHALAEQDVVYPLLHDRAGAAEEAGKLYGDHADIKRLLHTLEETPKGEPGWVAGVRELRDLIAVHARREEDVEFPRLRKLLGQDGLTRLSGQVQREKAMVA
ncbi:MAG: hemerythrin domain-containing protein [Dongiaceae bacterium]